MEVMTVLKYEKPCIFQELIKNESNAEIVIPITMDIRTAEKNLDLLLVQHMPS